MRARQSSLMCRNRHAHRGRKVGQAWSFQLTVAARRCGRLAGRSGGPPWPQRPMLLGVLRPVPQNSCRNVAARDEIITLAALRSGAGNVTVGALLSCTNKLARPTSADMNLPAIPRAHRVLSAACRPGSARGSYVRVPAQAAVPRLDRRVTGVNAWSGDDGASSQQANTSRCLRARRCGGGQDQAEDTPDRTSSSNCLIRNWFSPQ